MYWYRLRIKWDYTKRIGHSQRLGRLPLYPRHELAVRFLRTILQLINAYRVNLHPSVSSLISSSILLTPFPCVATRVFTKLKGFVWTQNLYEQKPDYDYVCMITDYVLTFSRHSNFHVDGSFMLEIASSKRKLCDLIKCSKWETSGLLVRVPARCIVLHVRYELNLYMLCRRKWGHAVA
jgi:hypothetical protein